MTLTVTRDDGAMATDTKEHYITVKGFCPLAASLHQESDIDLLYNVRNRLLTGSLGIRLVSLYYRHAFELVQILEENPSLKQQLGEMVTNNREVVEQWLASGQAAVPAAHVDEVVQVLESIKAPSSLRLRNDIDMFIAGLNDGSVLQEFHIQVE